MISKLSPREHDVARLLVEGASNKVIAARLGISSHTAKFHMYNVIKRLGAQTRVDAAVAYARWLDSQARSKSDPVWRDVVVA